MTFALIGNQNSGKTTLFNQLTGSNQRAGNFPGVTVDQKSGRIPGAGDTVADLPGIYSLSPYSGEEIVTRDFLFKQRPDAIINIVDATNIERNLYLTLQLIETQIPTVLALNMIDEVFANGWTIDTARLGAALGVPVVPISAVKKQGIDDLLAEVTAIARNRKKPERTDFCSGAVHRVVHAVSHLIEDHAAASNIPVRFAATRLVEGDALILNELRLTENETEMIEHAVVEMEDELGTDREAALADMRYQFIEALVKECVVKDGASREYKRSVGIDAALTHKIWAVPIFLGVMLLVFYVTFGVIGNRLSALLASLMRAFVVLAENALAAYGLNHIARALITDGILAGVGAVLGFLPIILLLLFFFSIMEDSGYMARIAFVTDRPLRRIGLSGRSVVPMLLGFGCTVPAALSSRTIPGERDRKMTILLLPFISCGAKLPIYAVFCAAFFERYQAFVMILLYASGVFAGIVSALIMKRFFFKGAPAPFVMELPNYRMPSVKSVSLLVWGKAAEFVKRAFTVILAATVVIWFLKSFDTRLNYVADGSDGMLAAIGRVLGVLMTPLGFSDWRVSTSLIAGFTAKEAVVGTLAVLTGAGPAELGGALRTMFTPLSAFSFLIFTLLYTPCVAAVKAMRREYGSVAGAVYAVLVQTGAAWLAAAAFYQTLNLLTRWRA